MPNDVSAKVRPLHWSVPPIEMCTVPRPPSQGTDDPFVTNLNHELRTPLAAIIGLTHVLGEEVDGPALEFVDLIRESGRRLQGTIERMLESVELEARSRAA